MVQYGKRGCTLDALVFLPTQAVRLDKILEWIVDPLSFFKGTVNVYEKGENSSVWFSPYPGMNLGWFGRGGQRMRIPTSSLQEDVGVCRKGFIEIWKPPFK